MVIQFLWWGYHILELSQLTAETDVAMNKRVTMIIGEALVFFPILFLGIWKIRSAIRKEIELNKRQSNFLLSVTHELKTPIASTRLYIQTILKRKSLEEEKKSELLNKALQENARLESLIKNILTASRIENHKVELNPIRTKIETLAKPIIDNWIAKGANIEEISLGSEAPVDHFIFETILNNLIDNALKYSQENAGISVTAHVRKDFTFIIVKDKGIGIPDAQKERIFKQFYRVGEEMTRTEKGSGIGLYLVSQFAKLHGGSVSVDDNPEGKGSVFIAKLSIHV